MKKFLLCALAGIFALSPLAQETGSSSMTSQEKIKQVVDLLESIEGYIFITKGETRELPVVFSKTDEVFSGTTDNALKAMDWVVYDNDIAVCHNNDGTVYGNNYGQTFMSVVDKDGVNHNFVVYVCPTIKIISPEGAIYSHQKIFGQRAKINFTQSEHYQINCVMMTYRGETVDVTDHVAMDEDDKVGGETDGFYETEFPIEDDVVFVVSMESRNANNNDAVVGDTNINIRVDDYAVTFYDPQDEIKNGAKIRITGQDKKTVVYNGPFYDDKTDHCNTINFNRGNSGIFFITIEGVPGEFKIIIEPK